MIEGLVSTLPLEDQDSVSQVIIHAHLEVESKNTDCWNRRLVSYDVSQKGGPNVGHIRPPQKKFKSCIPLQKDSDRHIF